MDEDIGVDIMDVNTGVDGADGMDARFLFLGGTANPYAPRTIIIIYMADESLYDLEKQFTVRKFYSQLKIIFEVLFVIIFEG